MTKPWEKRENHCGKRENDCLLHDCICRCAGCDPRGVLNDAASELYEALEAVVLRNGPIVYDEHSQRAIAALKKARGES